MIYLGNGMYSDVSLSHGGPWSKHKYIRIENGRYIYPEDIRGRGRGQRAIGAPPPVVGREGHERAKSSRYESEQNYKKADEALRRAVAPKKKLVNPPRPGDVLDWSFGGSDQGPSQAEKAQRVDGAPGSSRNTVTPESRYKDSVTNQGPSRAEKAKRKHDEIKRKERSERFFKLKIKDGYEERVKHRDIRREYANSHQGPSQAEKAQRNEYGSSRNTENKYNDTVTNQGPSQAEKAQRVGGTPGSSRNTVSRYGSKLYRDAVRMQGASQAEKAQRVNGKPGTSRNVKKTHDPKHFEKKPLKTNLHSAEKRGLTWKDEGYHDTPGVDIDYRKDPHYNNPTSEGGKGRHKRAGRKKSKKDQIKSKIVKTVNKALTGSEKAQWEYNPKDGRMHKGNKSISFDNWKKHRMHDYN